MTRASGLLLLLLAGCEPRKQWVSNPDAGTMRVAGLKGTHLGSCEDPACGNGTNPPLGGDHCGLTVACARHDTAQPRCSWIHNLEHGHAVLAYNCPAGCADLVAKLSALFDARRRILVTPDPKLPSRLAAIVWGYGWQGDSFDAAAVDEVLSHQDEEAPEAYAGCSP